MLTDLTLTSLYSDLECFEQKFQVKYKSRTYAQWLKAVTIAELLYNKPGTEDSAEVSLYTSSSIMLRWDQ